MTDAIPTGAPGEFLRDLGAGLILRRATPYDADALAAFNRVIHGRADAPDDGVAVWTRDLLTRPHPALGPQDFTVVEDTRTGAIVSSLNLISQTWTYDGIPFGVGRVELVGTDPAYRQRGLVRAQMEVVHRWSAERGHKVQAITGIPWYYRQFGYEMTLPLAGARSGPISVIPALKEGDVEQYRVRPATEADIPFIATTYAKAMQRYAVACIRDEAVWRHELLGQTPGGVNDRALCIIERIYPPHSPPPGGEAERGLTLHSPPGGGEAEGGPFPHSPPGGGEAEGGPTPHSPPGGGEAERGPLPHSPPGGGEVEGGPLPHSPPGGGEQEGGPLPVGFLQHRVNLFNTILASEAFELLPGVSWLDVTPSVLRYLKAQGQAYAVRDGQTLEEVGFWVEREHPVYVAAEGLLPRVRDPYAWYIRVPALPGFLTHIAPALERRLAASVAVGYTGDLKISHYRDGVRLVFEQGRLAAAEPWTPQVKTDEGDALFPDLTFLHLLFGDRSLEEVETFFADCYPRHWQARALLKILFPKQPSYILPVS